MTYIHFSIITLITGIIMQMTMYFVKFECRKMPLFMTIIFTIAVCQEVLKNFLNKFSWL
ncbi:TPA: hypothetical protein PCX62_002348 [Staphylococcus aureus]|nr:hypothetical protein [Staphylococcus aureus]